MKLTLRRSLTVAFVVLAVMALAACGGSASSGDQVASLTPADGGSTQAAGTSTTSTTGSGSFQDALLEFTKCMRANGVDIPDPTFDANGRPQFNQGQGGQQFDQNDPTFQAAQQKCGSTLQQARPQGSQADQQASQDAALEYAQCMRDNGVDMPDPDFSNGGPGQGSGGPFGNVNQSDPTFQAANEKCQSAFQNLPDPFGGGTTTGTDQ